jgi:hypothetical protein
MRVESSDLEQDVSAESLCDCSSLAKFLQWPIYILRFRKKWSVVE